MLRLRDPQLKLWDAIVAQPEYFRLPARLQDVDRYLDDDRFMEPFVKRGQQRVGRPTVPMERYLRLMFLKHERGLGYETLVQEVADSLTLRRFVRLDLSDPVPHPTTLSRLTQRFGDGAVAELHASLVKKLQEEGLCKGNKMRTDTTVMEADVKHPTDAGLLTDGVRVITRTVEKLKKVGTQLVEGFRDSTRTMKGVMWEIGRFLKKRATAAAAPGQTPEEAEESSAGKVTTADKKTELRQQVDRLTAKAAQVAARVVKQARDIAKRSRRRMARASQEAKSAAQHICLELVAWADLTQRALDQTALRLVGQTTIPNRMVSIFDPEARPIRKGKLSRPVEFGSLLEVTQVENMVVSDYKVHIGNPGDQTLLVGVVERHTQQFGRAPREVATDRGYYSAANEKKLTEMDVPRVSIPATGKPSAARAEHQGQSWFKRLQRWRAGSEGSISHLKRRYGMGWSRLDGQDGRSTWAGWGVFAHNLNVPGMVKMRQAKAAKAKAARVAKAAASTPEKPPNNLPDGRLFEAFSRTATRAELEQLL